MYLVLLCLVLQLFSFPINANGMLQSCEMMCANNRAMEGGQCGNDYACMSNVQNQWQNCASNCPFMAGGGGSSPCIYNCDAQGVLDDNCLDYGCRQNLANQMNACRSQCPMQNGFMNGQPMMAGVQAGSPPCLNRCMSSLQQEQALCSDQSCTYAIKMQTEQCMQSCQPQSAMANPQGYFQSYAMPQVYTPHVYSPGYFGTPGYIY